MTIAGIARIDAGLHSRISRTRDGVVAIRRGAGFALHDSIACFHTVAEQTVRAKSVILDMGAHPYRSLGKDSRLAHFNIANSSAFMQLEFGVREKNSIAMMLLVPKYDEIHPPSKSAVDSCDNARRRLSPEPRVPVDATTSRGTCLQTPRSQLRSRARGIAP